MAGVTVTLKKADFSRYAGLGEVAEDMVLYHLAAGYVKFADPVVPFLTGALKNSAVQAQSSWESGIIRYGATGPSSAYAAKQYYVPMNHRDGRRDHWLKHVETEYADNLREIAKKAALQAVRRYG